MPAMMTPLTFLLALLAGWVNRQQLAVIEYLQEENRILREKLSPKRILLNDDQRRRLAVKGKTLGRKALAEVGSSFSPQTILAWHRRLVEQLSVPSGWAACYDNTIGRLRRMGLGQGRVANWG